MKVIEKTGFCSFGGATYGCALGFQNFPYSGHLTPDHLRCFIWSLFAFAIFGIITLEVLDRLVSER